MHNLKLETAILYLLAIPRSVLFNFRHLPLRQALRLPILISHRVHIRRFSGRIKIHGVPQTASIRFGFGHVRNYDWRYSRTVVDVAGQLEFMGRAKFGHGTKLVVMGELIVGNRFNVTAETEIICKQRIEFGENCLISWGNLFIDHDYHKIYDMQSDALLNAPRPIKVGDNVWVGSRCIVLKGSGVGSHSVVGAGSLVNRTIEGEHQLIAGNPAKVVRKDIRWEH